MPSAPHSFCHPSRALSWLALAASWALPACLDGSTYPITDASVVMPPDAPPFGVFGEDKLPIFRVDAPFTLCINPPSTDDLKKLSADAAGMMLPFPRLPWVRLHDLELQFDYALTNQGANALIATVFVDGIDEFFYYAPKAGDIHQWQRRIALMPGQRATGSTTDVELDEVATDLATVVNGAPNSNLVVQFQSQSGRDPRVQPYIPKVIPGLVGVRAGIEVQGEEGDTKSPPLLLELTVHVDDHDKRACGHGDKPWMLPTPTAFAPVVIADTD